LINNLKTDWSVVKKKSKKELECFFEKINIPLKSRAEDLSKEDWKNILNNV